MTTDANTPETRLTAKDFKEPLLRIMGELTGMRAGVEVPYEKTLDKVFAIVGITDINAYGTNNNIPKPKRWVQWAFGTLQGQGLVESMGRGVWALTEAGVKSLKDNTPLPDSEVTPLEDEMEDTSLGTQMDAVAGSETVSLPIGYDTTLDYHRDVYINRLARAATPCFGSYSTEELICQACPMRISCINQAAQKFSELARLLATEASAGKAAKTAAATVPAPQPATSPSAPSTPRPADADASFNPDTVDFETARSMTAQSSMICKICRQVISVDEKAIWVRGKGAGGRGGIAAHPTCFDKVAPPGTRIANK